MKVDPIVRKVSRLEKRFTSSTPYREITLIVLECGHCGGGWHKGATPVACVCEQCTAEAQGLEDVEFLCQQSLYSRYKEFCGVASVLFYRRDLSSPSGVMLTGSARWSNALEDRIRAYSSSMVPLSPTER